jgi:hypothetical protein
LIAKEPKSRDKLKLVLPPGLEALSGGMAEREVLFGFGEGAVVDCQTADLGD